MTPSGPRVLYISGPFSHPDPVHGIPYETWIRGDLELLRRADAICMVGSWTKSPGALQEYRLARSLGMPVYRYIAEEIRPMPATMLPVYDALVEEAVP